MNHTKELNKKRDMVADFWKIESFEPTAKEVEFRKKIKS